MWRLHPGTWGGWQVLTHESWRASLPLDNIDNFLLCATALVNETVALDAHAAMFPVTAMRVRLLCVWPVPEQQLGHAQPELAELIRCCWAAEAVARPAFGIIVEELSELYAQEEAGLEPEPELGGSE
jgi:hypothetical protein